MWLLREVRDRWRVAWFVVFHRLDLLLEEVDDALDVAGDAGSAGDTAAETHGGEAVRAYEVGGGSVPSHGFEVAGEILAFLDIGLGLLRRRLGCAFGGCAALFVLKLVLGKKQDA